MEAQTAPGGRAEVEADRRTPRESEKKSTLRNAQAAVLLLLLAVLLCLFVRAFISVSLFNQMAWLPTPVCFAVVVGPLLALSVASVARQPRNLPVGCILVVSVLDVVVVSSLDAPSSGDPLGLLVLLLGVCGLLVATIHSSHRRGLKVPLRIIVLAGIALTALGPLAALAGCASAFGGYQTIVNEKSPDGRWALIVDYQNPGAMAPAYFTAAVVRERFGLVRQERELYSGDDVQAHWLNNTTVDVNGQAVNIFAKTIPTDDP